MLRRTTVALLTVAIVVLAGSFLIRVPVVRVVVVDGGDQVICARVTSDTPITLTFTHSMYGGDVRETYQPADDGLVRTRIVTGNAAAAEYYAFYGGVTEIDDGFEVAAPDTAFDAVTVTVDRIGNHRLQIGDDTYTLAEMLRETTSVLISVSDRPFALHLLDRDC